MSIDGSELPDELASDRLRILADTIRVVRDGTVALADASQGDDIWSTGCRVYERTINIFVQLAKSGRYPWLAYRRKGLYFLLIVGGNGAQNGIPIRFYKGDVTNASPNRLTCLQPEREALQMALPFLAGEYLWRIVIETESDGKTLRILLARYDISSKTCTGQWVVWDVASPTATANSLGALPEGTILDSPDVTLTDDQVDEDADNDEAVGL